MPALYTILLGNPRFIETKKNPAAETRFKIWWHIVGAAVEHAAKCRGDAVSFKNLFLSGERDDEQMAALAEVLTELRRRYPGDREFKARDIVGDLRTEDFDNIAFRMNLEGASGRGMPVTTVQTVSMRLRSCVDRPTLVDGKTLTLRFRSDHEGGWFCVETMTARGQS